MSVLAGRVCVVTGATSGIGRATAELFAGEGAVVIATGRDQRRGDELAERLGPPHRFVRADVTDAATWTGLLTDVEAAHGRLDVLVLNAGVMSRAPTDDSHDDPLSRLTVDNYRRMVATNVDGTMIGIIAALPLLEAQGGGAILITGGASVEPFAPDPLYTLTKHATSGFARAIAPALEARGITINTLIPASTDSGMVAESMKVGGGPDEPPRSRNTGLPFQPPSRCAEAFRAILECGGTGQTWISAWSHPPMQVELFRPRYGDLG